MGVKAFRTECQDFAQESLTRTNFKTVINGIEIKRHIQKSNQKFVMLKEYFDIVSGFAFKSEDYETEGVPLIRIGDVGNDFVKEKMSFLPEEYAVDYSKFLLKTNDIVVSLTGDGKLKSDLIIDHNHYLLNQRVGSLRAKSDINTLFYFYLINYYSFVKKQFYWLSNGKTQLNISPFDFLKIKIPKIPKEIQDQIVTKIEPIEQKIKELKNQIQPEQTIINKVFARRFGFDFVKFEELKKHTIFDLDFTSFANNIDVRQSVKFHRNAGKFVLQQLKSKTNKKIKDFLSEPIVLGKGISPSEYDENGDVFYIAMSNIKNWQFEAEEAKTVSPVFANTNLNKMVALNDILLARSGEGTIGKVALIEDENVEGIFADFTMRIRLKDYNYLFAYFYFRTTYFQYLVEIHKKGLGNNTNIFPSQIQEFPLFDISLIEQQQIVDEIESELNEQEKVKQAIAEERNKIDELIENSIDSKP